MELWIESNDFTLQISSLLGINDRESFKKRRKVRCAFLSQSERIRIVFSVRLSLKLTKLPSSPFSLSLSEKYQLCSQFTL